MPTSSWISLSGLRGEIIRTWAKAKFHCGVTGRAALRRRSREDAPITTSKDPSARTHWPHVGGVGGGAGVGANVGPSVDFWRVVVLWLVLGLGVGSEVVVLWLVLGLGVGSKVVVMDVGAGVG